MRIPLLVTLVALSAACASGSPNPRSSSVDNDVLRREELEQRGFLNAYEAVAALRPQWLRTRGLDSFRNPTQVQVYVDQSRMGGIEALRMVRIDGVGFIRYYDGTNASTRWGLGHGQGVIYVSTSQDAHAGIDP